MTREESIKECQEFWGEIEQSGLCESDFLYNTEGGKRWRQKRYRNNCPLCEYSYIPSNNDCSLCPLPTHPERKTSKCLNLGFSYSDTPSQEWLAIIRGLS